MSDRPGKTALARLSAVAQTQGGFFTAKQAKRAGFDPTHHTYHVRAGNWERVHRGIYRLARYPRPERSDLITWSLWSRDRRHDRPQGVFSHQTALSLYELSDVMPVELHLTVPPGFRRTAPPPAGLRLHHAELAAGEIREHEGYRVTSPLRAITDVAHDLVLKTWTARSA